VDKQIDEQLREQLREQAHISPPPDLAARAVSQALAAEGRARSSGSRLLSSLALASLAVVVAGVLLWRAPTDNHGPSASFAAPPLATGDIAMSTAGATVSPDPSRAPTEFGPTIQPAIPATSKPDPSVVESPAPTQPLSDLERSDRFWRASTDYGPYEYEYTSLDEMAAEAHLIIHGRVVGLQHGLAHPYNDWPPYGTTIALVEIVETLKGQPNTRVEGIIQVQNLGWGMTDADLPGDEVVLFLFNDAALRKEYGVGLSDPENQPFRYVRPNPYQTALRIIDGEFRFLRPGRTDRGYRQLFPAELDGRKVESLVNDIRKAVESHPSSD
jgi:hypothetical protein